MHAVPTEQLKNLVDETNKAQVELNGMLEKLTQTLEECLYRGALVEAKREMITELNQSLGATYNV